ncbi:MAG: MFS transporter [Litorilinea sp.]
MDRHLNTLGLVGYLFIGTAAVLIPAVMPFITEEYAEMGLTLAAIGLIFPARSAGGILGNLLAGIGSDRIGRRRMVWLSALFLAGAMAVTALIAPWPIFLAAFVLISAAQASLSTGINAMIADANRGARARALNTLHGVYGVGAAISPLIIGYIIDQGVPWRWAIGGTGIIWLIYGVAAALLYDSDRAHPTAVTTDSATDSATDPRADAPVKTRALDMLRQGAFLSLFLIAFIYNGVAYSLLGWIAVFMESTAGFSTFLSIAMISIFYIALTIGRFICAGVSERVGYATTLLVLSAGITLTYPLVVLGIHSLWVTVVGVFLTGLSLSGLFPMVLAYGARLYPEQTGTVSGTLNVAMTLGAMIPPLWTGILAETWGLQFALGVNYILVLPMIFLALYLGRVEQRTPITQPAPGD